MRNIHAVLMLIASCVLVLPGCSEPGETESLTVHLTSSEIAMLLGVSETQGVRFGDIVSDQRGVRVESLKLDDSQGRELELRGIDIQIRSTGPLAYAISHLQIAELDLHDWSNNQRTRISRIEVDRPGDHFLTGLEAAVVEVKSTGVLRTAGLSFSKLTLGQIDYMVRKEDSSFSKVTVDQVGIDQATAKTIGEFQIARIRIDDAVAVENLRFKEVDRDWTDRMLTHLVHSTSSTSAVDSKLPAAALGAPGEVFVPFDHFSVDRLTVEEELPGQPGKKISASIQDLRFDVRRDTQGRFTGLSGRAQLHLPLELFGAEIGGGIAEVTRSQLTDSLALSVLLDMHFNPRTKVETFQTLSVEAPGLFTVRGSLQSQGITPLLNMLFLDSEDTGKLEPLFSKFAVRLQDDGLFAYLLSSRFSNRESFTEFLTAIPEIWKGGAERQRLTAEIGRFKAAPGMIALSLEAKTPTSPPEFFDFSKFSENNPANPVQAKLEFTHR